MGGKDTILLKVEQEEVDDKDDYAVHEMLFVSRRSRARPLDNSEGCGTGG